MDRDEFVPGLRLTQRWHGRKSKHPYGGKIAPFCTVRYGTVRYGTVRYGTVRYGTVRYGTVRYGTVRYGTVRYGTVRYGSLRCSTIRYGTPQYDIIRYDTTPTRNDTNRAREYACVYQYLQNNDVTVLDK